MPPADVLDFLRLTRRALHLIFDDWDRAIARQQRILTPLLGTATPRRILDFACGIGTQSLAFAQAGHHVTGTDLSPAEIARARREAQHRSLEVDSRVADMTSLANLPDSRFDMVCAFDNALPHLTRPAEALTGTQPDLRSHGFAQLSQGSTLPKCQSTGYSTNL